MTTSQNSLARLADEGHIGTTRSVMFHTLYPREKKGKKEREMKPFGAVGVRPLAAFVFIFVRVPFFFFFFFAFYLVDAKKETLNEKKKKR